MRRRAGVQLLVAAGACICAVLAPDAQGRTLYAADPDGDALNTFDLGTGQGSGGPIGLGLNSSPGSVAVTPDGRKAVVANEGAKSVSVIDATTRVASAPITVGNDPEGVSIAPDGGRAYVANNGDGTVSVIDLTSNKTVGQPIEVGGEPLATAVSPDGSRVYVANHISESVSVIDTSTGQTTGPEIKVGGGPTGLAVTPDGRQVYVSDGFGYLYVIDAATGLVYEPITIGTGTQPTDVAVTPNGARAYVSNYQTGTVSVVDTASRQVLGEPIPVGEHLGALAVTPNGARAMVVRYGPGITGVSTIDTALNQVVGFPLVGGLSIGGIAIEPDQPPVSSFAVPARARPGVPVTLDGSASRDPDGSIGSWSWALGDGSTAATPTVSHAYAAPGRYPVSLSLADTEGCSTAMVFSGQTAYCSGGPAATSTRTLTVAYPGVTLRCPKGSKGGCRFIAKAVQRKKKNKLKALSAVARGRAKAGRSVTISLKPKAPFAGKLADALKLQVQVTTKINGSKETRVKKLEVVQ